MRNLATRLVNRILRLIDQAVDTRCIAVVCDENRLLDADGEGTGDEGESAGENGKRTHVSNVSCVRQSIKLSKGYVGFAVQ